MFTILRAVHTIKGDNSKCIYFSELCPFFDLEKLWHFVISLLLLKILTWKSDYAFTIKTAIHTIKRVQFLMHFFFFRIMPFFNFLSSIKHPTAKHWHAVLLLSNNLKSKPSIEESLLKTLLEKNKMLVTSIFSFSHIVFKIILRSYLINVKKWSLHCCNYLFFFQVTFSMLEIYNENVRDLLNSSGSKSGLKVRQHPKLGFYGK